MKIIEIMSFHIEYLFFKSLFAIAHDSVIMLFILYNFYKCPLKRFTFSFHISHGSTPNFYSFVYFYYIIISFCTLPISIDYLISILGVFHVYIRQQCEFPQCPRTLILLLIL